MPDITFRKDGTDHTEAVADNTNLVVRAGIKKFPWPHLRYGCGMGKCGKCTSRILAGAEHLPEPNWKEKLLLGDARIANGDRLICQLWLHNDLALTQDGVVLPPPVRATPTPRG